MRRIIVSAFICLFAATAFASEPADKEVQETITTKSGMQYTSLKEGTGASPGPTDTVRVHYRGMLMNGREFDSSYRKGRPADFKLDSVIKCWTEGLQLMKVGGKARLVCPSNLAYGDEGIMGVVPRFATLTFDVELIAIR
jgi:FKBP-type peptidyl-prolyl cis-trans isomerase FkpA